MVVLVGLRCVASIRAEESEARSTSIARRLVDQRNPQTCECRTPSAYGRA